MASAKEAVVENSAAMGVKIHDWVRLTYEYFDTYPDAFTYVLLTPHDFPDELNEIATRQGRMLMEMLDPISRARVPPLTGELALSHFTGLMLNVPRLINEGALSGTASSFTEEVVNALLQVFGVASSARAAVDAFAPDGEER